MNINFNNLLPVGSVCELKSGDAKIMICGYFFLSKNSKEVFTYFGVVYPFGIINKDLIYSFNDDDIGKIFFVGYKSMAFDVFKYSMNSSTRMNFNNNECLALGGLLKKEMDNMFNDDVTGAKKINIE